VSKYRKENIEPKNNSESSVLQSGSYGVVVDESEK